MTTTFPDDGGTNRLDTDGSPPFSDTSVGGSPVSDVGATGTVPTDGTMTSDDIPVSDSEVESGDDVGDHGPLHERSPTPAEGLGEHQPGESVGEWLRRDWEQTKHDFTPHGKS